MARPNRLAVKIRDVRVRAGLSQADFGASVGVSEGTVYNWEAGRTKRIGKPALRMIEFEYGLEEDSLVDLAASVERQRLYNERRKFRNGRRRS